MKFRFGSFVVGFENGEVIEDAVRMAAEDVRKRTASELRAILSNARKDRSYALQAIDLRGEIETLKIEKATIKEEHSRKDREIEHKVGLQRTRQTMEVEIAKRETTVQVREENLVAQEDRFKEHMDFLTGRLEGEVKYQREMIADMIERMPSAKILANLSNVPAPLRAVGDDE